MAPARRPVFSAAMMTVPAPPIEDQIASLGHVPDRISDQCHGLDRWVHGEFGRAAGAENIHARIVPNVRARAPMLAQFDIVAMWLRPQRAGANKLARCAIVRG